MDHKKHKRTKSTYGNASLHGGDVAVQFWRGAELARGPAGEQSADGNTGCEHHGQQADGEHHAIRYVLINGESHCRSRNGRGAGRVDADALRSRDPRTVGPRSADGPDRKHASAR